MSASASARAPLASTCLDLLDRSRGSLLLACRTGDAGERYVEAHLGALRAAAALLAARSLPGSASGSPSGATSGATSSTGRAIRASSPRSRPRSVWELLPRVAPELTEWSAFFAASARRRAAVERGGVIQARESDDLLRQAENFLEIVQDLLGLPRVDALAPISRYVAPLTVTPGAGRAGAGGSGTRDAGAGGSGAGGSGAGKAGAGGLGRVDDGR